MTDEQLIGEVLAGEHHRFSELVSRHQRVLLQYLWNIAPNQHDCEELAQETLLRVFRHLAQFDRGRSSFRTWLLTIARNLAYNHSSKHRPHSMAELPETLSRDPDPGSNLERREWLQRLDTALAALSIEQRSAFVLIEIQELSYSEAAAIEDVAVGTIKSRVSRAKQQVRECLTRDGELYRKSQGT